MGLFGFGKKRPNGSQAPARQDDALRSRYEGRPLLLILDNYIVDCLGMLAPDKRDGMGAMVQKTFGGGEDWRKTIRERLKIHDSLDERIRQS